MSDTNHIPENEENKETVPETKPVGEVDKSSKQPNGAKKGLQTSLREASKKMPVGPGNFWNNILSTVLLLVFVSAAYSYLTDTRVKPVEISVSEAVTQVKSGEVKEIVVRGSVLELTYTDENRTPAEAKKETDAAVSETLTNLGVTAEELSRVSIDVQRETGFAYWLGNFAPFLFPLVFLGIIIWFFTRSMKGAGIQALNFGSSKARMIDPNEQ